MNLRLLTDQTLLASTERLVQQERQLLVEILHHLREIERRRLFSDLGYSSLFTYCTDKLGYSSDQAARRISAMRLLKDIPEMEEKLQTGALSLTNAAMAQTHFKHEERTDKPLSAEKKREVLHYLEGKSSREAERALRDLNPKPAVEDRVKPMSNDLVEIRFSAPRELEEKLQQLKGLLAHSHPQITLAELVDQLASLALKEWNPAKEPKRASNRNKSGSLGAPLIRRRVAKALEREVWRRDQRRCQQCHSQHGLEIDHIRPVALGGESKLDNLRLLCRPCNQRAAIHSFGVEKMEPYLASS